MNASSNVSLIMQWNCDQRCKKWLFSGWFSRASSWNWLATTDWREEILYKITGWPRRRQRVKAILKCKCIDILTQSVLPQNSCILKWADQKWDHILQNVISFLIVSHNMQAMHGNLFQKVGAIRQAEANVILTRIDSKVRRVKVIMCYQVTLHSSSVAWDCTHTTLLNNIFTHHVQLLRIHRQTEANGLINFWLENAFTKKRHDI